MKKTIKIVKKITGTLTMPETNLNEISLVLVNKTETNFSSFNLTESLKELQGKEIGILVKFAGLELMCEVEKVYILNGLTVINGVCIEHRLWDFVGQELKLTIEYTEEVL